MGFVDVGEQAEGFGDFPFSDFVYLQVNFLAQRVDGGLAVLADEDEDREEDGLQGNDHGKQNKGEGIDDRQPFDLAGVYGYPENEEKGV